MATCYGRCTGDYKGITSSELDRFTDEIENVLNNQKGRVYFKKFMEKCEMKDSLEYVKFWEHIDKLLKEEVDPDSPTYQIFLDDFSELIKEARKIELDVAAMEKLEIAREGRNKDDINETLNAIKKVTTNVLERVYKPFRLELIKLK